MFTPYLFEKIFYVAQTSEVVGKQGFAQLHSPETSEVLERLWLYELLNNATVKALSAVSKK